MGPIDHSPSTSRNSSDLNDGREKQLFDERIHFAKSRLQKETSETFSSTIRSSQPISHSEDWLSEEPPSIDQSSAHASSDLLGMYSFPDRYHHHPIGRYMITAIGSARVSSWKTNHLCVRYLDNAFTQEWHSEFMKAIQDAGGSIKMIDGEKEMKEISSQPQKAILEKDKQSHLQEKFNLITILFWSVPFEKRDSVASMLARQLKTDGTVIIGFHEKSNLKSLMDRYFKTVTCERVHLEYMNVFCKEPKLE